MTHITTITLRMPLNMGEVNCYLVQNGDNFVLIDSGFSMNRPQLEHALEQADCQPGNLKLLLLTHGDFDHTGNATYLRQKYGTKIAMHRDDWGMLEQGDMFYNRKRGNPVMRWLAPRLIGFGKDKRCTPDIAVEEGYDLSPFGIEAKILSLPGHSKGSIGVLTGDGDLFCGDLLENTSGTPRLGSIVDDAERMQQSVEKLKVLGIKTVYPGHGKPFEMEALKISP